MPSENDDKGELEALILELGLTSDLTDKGVLRSEVKCRISELHPDHTAAHSADRLQKLQTLLKKLGRDETSLQIVNQRVALGLLEPTSLAFKNEIEAKIRVATATQQNVSSRTFLYPKISLSALTAAVAGTIAFPRTLMNHPFAGPILKSRYAPVIWIFTVGILGFAWLSIWLIEQAKQRKIEQLHSLSYQRSVLDQIGNEDDGAFSASHFSEMLCSRDTIVFYPEWLRKLAKLVLRRNIYYFRKPFYDLTLVDEAVDLALERFLTKGWIVRSERPENAKQVDDWYRFAHTMPHRSNRPKISENEEDF